MRDSAAHSGTSPGPESALVKALGQRSIVLVGMMGAGKTSVGRRLAARLSLPFIDADVEIESAAGMSIPDIFSEHGEPYFRAGEARVITRLLKSGPQVLATGGGAFMDAQTRERISAQGISVWLKADLETLLRRVRRRAVGDRPMLKSDPAEALRELMERRYPVYEQADITVHSREVQHEIIVEEIVAALKARFGFRTQEQGVSS